MMGLERTMDGSMKITYDRSAQKEIALMLGVDIEGIDPDTIAGFDKNGIIRSDLPSMIELSDRMKG